MRCDIRREGPTPLAMLASQRLLHLVAGAGASFDEFRSELYDPEVDQVFFVNRSMSWFAVAVYGFVLSLALDAVAAVTAVDQFLLASSAVWVWNFFAFGMVAVYGVRAIVFGWKPALASHRAMQSGWWEVVAPAIAALVLGYVAQP